MAATSLWHIEGHLGTLVDYVENPEKTVKLPENLRDMADALAYVQRPGAAPVAYVDTLNCFKETALRQMLATKRRFGKEDGYLAWHGYQSFKPGEVDADLCHEIGLETARRMWGDRFQVVVTTHLDKDHLHNHFLINSVSFLDGRKYNYSKAERRRFMNTSDEICLAHGLSVIEHPHKAPARPVWLDEKSGKPTRYNIYREDIRDAVNGSMNKSYMERYLHRLGYVTDFSGAHWKIRLPQYKHFTRLDTLDPRWTPDYVLSHMGSRTRYGNMPARVSFPVAVLSCEPDLKTSYVPHKPTSRLYGLYLYYCYQLGILPRRTRYAPTSPFLKEELRKLDRYDAAVRYMTSQHIKTLEELRSHRSELLSSLDSLRNARCKVQNRIRHADPETRSALTRERDDLTAQIFNLRKMLRINQNIEKDSLHIQETMDRVVDNERSASADERHQDRERNARQKGLER